MGGTNDGSWFDCPIHSVRSSAGSHPASCSMDTGKSFPGVKRSRSEAYQSNRTGTDYERSYTCTPPTGRHGMYIIIIINVRTESGAQPVPYSICTGALPQGSSGRFIKLTIHLNLREPSLRRNGAIRLLPLYACTARKGEKFITFVLL
jgi:hypothetical protein